MNDEVELTPEEKMAFENLPREARPSDLLEERIVGVLRHEGILRSRTERAASPSHPTRVRWVRPWMAAAAAAASLVLFGAGVWMGQWMGARSTTEAFLAVREQDAAQLALRIQEAGSVYVSALAALGELRGASDQGAAGDPVAIDAAREIQQGRAAALGALYGAAFELARMAPGDADVFKILQILEERRTRDVGGTPAGNVVWF